jgi:hypothetical protein
VRFYLIKVPVFSKFAFFELDTILLQIFFLDATFISVGDVKNVFGFKKSAVLLVALD